MLPPLPAPDAVAIHVHGTSGQAGPYSRRDLHARLANNASTADDSFWFEGMDGWARIGSHPDLFGDFDGSAKNESKDDRNDRLFGGLVQASWAWYNSQRFSTHVDEVFLGAVITTILDQGYALIDLSSDGTHHYTRFQNLKDNTRIMVRVTHLTQDPVRAKVLGNRASVIIGYGERSDDFGRIMQALKAEVKSGYIQTAEPGTITVDGDLPSGYVYVSVDLYLNIDDYVAPSYAIDYTRLKEHLDVTLHALRKYLRGRFAK